MYPQPDNNLLRRRLLVLLGLAMVVFSVLTVVLAVNIRRTTGLMDIRATDANSTLTVSSANHEAKFVGITHARVRLIPGAYQVTASHSGIAATQTVVVTKERPTSVKLTPRGATTLPSIYTIQFLGVKTLLDHGLTTDQLGSLEHALFNFMPSAKIDRLDSSSVEPGPHDPDSASAAFSTKFDISIDSKKYNAVIVYSFYKTVNLYLYRAGDSSPVYSYEPSAY